MPVGVAGYKYKNTQSLSKQVARVVLGYSLLEKKIWQFCDHPVVGECNQAEVGSQRGKVRNKGANVATVHHSVMTNALHTMPTGLQWPPCPPQQPHIPYLPQNTHPPCHQSQFLVAWICNVGPSDEHTSRYQEIIEDGCGEGSFNQRTKES